MDTNHLNENPPTYCVDCGNPSEQYQCAECREKEGEKCSECGAPVCELGCGCHACERKADEAAGKPAKIDPHHVVPANVTPAAAPDPIVVVRFLRDPVKNEWVVFVQCGTNILTTTTKENPAAEAGRLIGSFYDPSEHNEDALEDAKLPPEAVFDIGCHLLANDLSIAFYQHGVHTCVDCKKQMMTVCRGCQEKKVKS